MKIHSHIWVCDDCMFVHANGECDPERPEDLPEPWARWTDEPYDLAMGGEHAEECTEEDRAKGCDCDEIQFSKSSCEGCGDVHYGRRHAFTVFYRADHSGAHTADAEALAGITADAYGMTVESISEITYEHVTTDQLQNDDIVHIHGMRLFLENGGSAVQSNCGCDPEKGCRVVWFTGRITNRHEIADPFIRSLTRDGTWRVQGNHLATWTREVSATTVTTV